MGGEVFDENFEELERHFEAQYSIEDLLGEGTYGKVFKARNKRSGQTVAMKKMKLLEVAQEEGIPSTALREVALLKELTHENIVRLEEIFCSPKKLVLVFEYVESDLKKYMRSLGRPLTPAIIKNLTFQLCRGTEFCHANRIIHRDIKPQNLLIEHSDGRLRLKIADFGLARTYSIPVPKYTHEVVTVWYRPLEILLGSPLYSVPVDLWSIGCVAAEMATGAPLFAGDSEIDTIFKIFQKLGTPSTEQWPGLAELPDFKPTFPKWPHRGWENIRNTKAQMGSVGIDILESLMAYDPKKRMSARRSLLHAYFADVERRDGF
jgi:serine/threonine protein kinase